MKPTRCHPSPRWNPPLPCLQEEPITQSPKRSRVKRAAMEESLTAPFSLCWAKNRPQVSRAPAQQRAAPPAGLLQVEDVAGGAPPGSGQHALVHQIPEPDQGPEGPGERKNGSSLPRPFPWLAKGKPNSSSRITPTPVGLPNTKTNSAPKHKSLPEGCCFPPFPRSVGGYEGPLFLLLFICFPGLAKPKKTPKKKVGQKEAAFWETGTRRPLPATEVDSWSPLPWIGKTNPSALSPKEKFGLPGAPPHFMLEHHPGEYAF